MLLTRRLFFVKVNQKLFVCNLNRHQMAPVTRPKKTLANVNGDTTTKITNKVAKLKNSQARPADVNKQKSARTSTVQETGKDGLPMIPFPSQSDLENWLRTNHTDKTGVWVKIAKKSSSIPTVTYEEMLDVALCYGWIDGQRCSLDETWFLQRITPRRPKSNWSQINREKVKRLIRMGKMQPAGQLQIDEAMADGRWDNASKPSSGCVVPDELAAAVEESSPEAIKSFGALSKPDKLDLINRIEQTTSEADRRECIRSIVSKLERGEGVSD